MAQSVERLTEKSGAILTQVRVPGAARDFFSQCQLPVQTILRPRVQSLASPSARTLKIPNTTIVWPHENTPHTDRNG